MGMMTFVSVLTWEKPKIEQALRDELDAMPESLRRIAAHVLMAGGKRIRPLMTLNAARMCGAEGGELYRLACIPEMIHAATLLHDDVLDGADRRRGVSAAHVVYGTAQAILAGDALLAAASHRTAAFGVTALLSCVSEAVLMTAEGEAREMALQHSLTHGMDEYERIAAGKTGWLIKSSCRLGALFAGAPEAQTEALSEYGLNLGIAFQIVDDALDFADPAVTGKPAAGDLTEGKLTPPVMKYLDFLPHVERDAFRGKFEKGTFTPEDRERIAADIRRLGFDAEARALAGVYLDRAEASLESVPESGQPHKVFREALEFVRKRAS